MSIAPLPPHEARRLKTLGELGVLDAQTDPVLDGLVRSAALLADCPISLVSLVDETRQWLKARHGLDVSESPREVAFCAHAILSDGLFEVPDALSDPRFADNPLVTGAPHVVFYAGMPLMVDGDCMGTLCVIDHRVRRLTGTQREILRDLARAVEHWLRSQRVHELLRRTDAERRDLLDHMGDGMLLLDQDRRVIDANPAAVQMLGYSRGELLHKQLQELLPVDAHARLARVIAEQPLVSGRLNEWPHQRRDGSVFWAEVSTRQVDAHRHVSVLRDITERRAQEHHLRLLSEAMEQSAESVLITDLEGRVEYVNAAAMASSGYPRHEMLGRNPRMLQSGRTPPDTYRDMWTHLLAGKAWRGQFFNRRKDGVEYQEDAVITPIRDAQGRITQYLALMMDVTEKRRMAQELARYQQHLEELVEHRTVALVDARRAAEAASEAKSAFLATMSHEIRTPMNGVVGIIDVLQRSNLTPYQRDLADTITESAFALLRIIEDVLDFSKIEAGHMTLESEPVALRRLVDSVCDGLRTSATSRSVALHVSVDPGLPDWIESDAVRLRQILNNLLGNAIKFSAGTSRVGRVELWVEPAAAGHFQLRVIDNGIGMTPEVLARIFQPFVQAEACTTRRFGGTGLGLSICRRLASLFGGWTAVDSEAGRGSTFTVTLPLKAAPPPEAVRERDSVERAMAAPPFAASGGPLVLVAEDNEINQKVIRRQLALLGLEVEMAHDGLDALARWRAGRSSQRHGLLLTDLHMPGIDGYALAAAIRSEEPEGQRLPIVALSANAMRGEIDRCRQAGMDDYLSKPVQLQQLGVVLQRWIDLRGLAKVDRGMTDVQEATVLPPLQVFDEEALVVLVGDDPATLAEFRQRYRASALATMDEMRAALSEGNLAELAWLAHRLKSSSRAMGAMALGACCEEVERAGASGGAAMMHALMVHMEDAMAQMMSRLSPLVGRDGRQPGAVLTGAERA